MPKVELTRWEREFNRADRQREKTRVMRAEESTMHVEKRAARIYARICEEIQGVPAGRKLSLTKERKIQQLAEREPSVRRTCEEKGWIKKPS